MLKRRWTWLALVVLLIYPFVPFVNWLGAPLHLRLDTAGQMVNVFVFALLALALNVVVGYTGLLQLGIAAFFAIGAYTTGLVTVEKYPFRFPYAVCLVVGPLVAGICGIVLGSPTLRLRGDYLAIVTLGFGEMVRVALLNLFEITGGPQGLNPIPPPLPEEWMKFGPGKSIGAWYYLALFAVMAVVFLLTRLEGSRLGRAWMAIREDELAASCMGINPVRAKLSAFALSSAIAGLAGVLYAGKLTTTAEPATYDFNYSIMVLCCVIIGGMGSIYGVLLGAFVLIGFDNVISPALGEFIVTIYPPAVESFFLTPSSYRWIIYGLVLVLMMRFRPEGLLPSRRMKEELHAEANPG